jgi:hypothetical protein
MIRVKGDKEIEVVVFVHSIDAHAGTVDLNYQLTVDGVIGRLGIVTLSPAHGDSLRLTYNFKVNTDVVPGS